MLIFSKIFYKFTELHLSYFKIKDNALKLHHFTNVKIIIVSAVSK